MDTGAGKECRESLGKRKKENTGELQNMVEISAKSP
jgi:hypothetical protein